MLFLCLKMHYLSVNDGKSTKVVPVHNPLLSSNVKSHGFVIGKRLICSGKRCDLIFIVSNYSGTMVK